MKNDEVKGYLLITPEECSNCSFEVYAKDGEDCDPKQELAKFIATVKNEPVAFVGENRKQIFGYLVRQYDKLENISKLIPAKQRVGIEYRSLTLKVGKLEDALNNKDFVNKLRSYEISDLKNQLYFMKNYQNILMTRINNWREL